MFPISSAASRVGDAGGVEHRTAQVELPDADAASVESFAFDGVPRLRPGDRVFIKSGVSGFYRRVARVEPISGGGALIWLDTGYSLVRHTADK